MRSTQVSSIDFVNYVEEKFPFRIKMIRTDNRHEFQTQFHWHIKDLGMEHVYIKTDKREFYQILDYSDNGDLHKKLAQWEDYYNFLRSQAAHMGKAPDEQLKQCMLG